MPGAAVGVDGAAEAIDLADSCVDGVGSGGHHKGGLGGSGEKRGAGIGRRRSEEAGQYSGMLVHAICVWAAVAVDLEVREARIWPMGGDSASVPATRCEMGIAPRVWVR